MEFEMGSLVAEIPDGIHVPMLYMYLGFTAVLLHGLL